MVHRVLSTESTVSFRSGRIRSTRKRDPSFRLITTLRVEVYVSPHSTRSPKGNVYFC